MLILSIKLPLHCLSLHVHQFHQVCTEYVHEGCDQTTLALCSGVSQCLLHQQSKAAWDIKQFPIYKRFSPVQLAAVYFEYGCHVYYIEHITSDQVSGNLL